MREPSADVLVRELNADLLTGRLFHLAPPEQGALVHTAVTACHAGRVVDAARAFITLHHGSGVARFLACVEALALYATGESDPWTAAAIYGLLFRYTADPNWEHRRQLLLRQHPVSPPSARSAPRGPLAGPSVPPAVRGPGPSLGAAPSPVLLGFGAGAGSGGAPAFGAPSGYGAPQPARSTPMQASTPPPRLEPTANRLGLPPVRAPQALARAESPLASEQAARPSLAGGYGPNLPTTSGPLVQGGSGLELTPLPSGPRPSAAPHHARAPSSLAPSAYAAQARAASAPNALAAGPGAAPLAPFAFGGAAPHTLGAPGWGALHPDHGEPPPAHAHPATQPRGPAPRAVRPTPPAAAPIRAASPPRAGAFELPLELPVEHEPVAPAPATPTHQARRWSPGDGVATDDGVDDLPGAPILLPPTRPLSVDIPLAAPFEYDSLPSIPLLPHLCADLVAGAAESPPAPRLTELVAAAARAHAAQPPEVSFEGLLGRADEVPTQRLAVVAAEPVAVDALVAAEALVAEALAAGGVGSEGFVLDEFAVDGCPAAALAPGARDAPLEATAEPLGLPPLPDVFGASASSGPRRPR
jgi:hypothetical protein